MKYAIAQTSGKQFLLKPGQWYDVDFINNGNLGEIGRASCRERVYSSV